MGIVRFALKFPYTFYGLAALILFLGTLAIVVMPVDIFPEEVLTPFGLKRVGRQIGEILQPSLLTPATLDIQRRSMTDYNFVAQYQQDPQPPSGIIVKREWLKFYG